MSISVAIQNPNSKPANQAVLYLGEKNTLHFIFTKMGNVQDPRPGDQFIIKIPAGLLEAAGAANVDSPDWNAQVTHSGTEYSFTLSPKKTIAFDGNKQLMISLINLEGVTATNDTIATQFTIGGRRVSGAGVKLFVVAAPDQPKDLHDAISFAPPFINQAQDDHIQSGQVYISPVKDQNQVAVPIANTIHVNLKFNPESGSLSTQWDSQNKPTFIFSFATGASDFDLTDALEKTDPGYNALTTAWSIVANLGDSETDQWTKPAQIPRGSSPTWEVYPQSNNQGLFSSGAPNLDVVFTQVISILPPGDATLYIQWSNIPGYNAGFKALDLLKAVAVPQILSFQGPGSNPDFNSEEESLTLKWESFGVASLNLLWDDKRGNPKGNNPRNIPDIQAYDDNNHQLTYNGSISIYLNKDGNNQNTNILDSQNTKFTLQAFIPETDKSGNTQQVQVDEKTTKVYADNFPSPSFDAQKGLVGSLIMDNNIPTGYSFSWLVNNLGNGGTISIDGKQVSDPGQYNGFPGNTTIPQDLSGLAPIPLDHAIVANQNNNNKQEKAAQTITLDVPNNLSPKIVNYQGAINRDANNNASSVALSWQVQYAVHSEADSSKNTICQIIGKDTAITFDRTTNTWSTNIPISPAAPIQSRYTLQVSNPGGGTTKQALKLHFVKDTSWSASGIGGVTVDAVALNADGSQGALALRLSNGDYCYYEFDTANYQAGMERIGFPSSPYPDESQLQSLGISPDNDPDHQKVLVVRNNLYGTYLSSQSILVGPNFEVQGEPGLALATLSLSPSGIDTWVGQRSNGVAGISRNFFFLNLPIVPRDVQYTQRGQWWQPNVSVVDLALTKDGSRLFVADYANGFVFYFDTNNIPTYLDDHYSPIMESYQVQSISIFDNEWVYWLGGCDPNDSRQNHYPTPSLLLHSLNLGQSDYGYHPWIPIPYNGTDSILMKVVAGSNCVFVISPGEELFHLVAGAPFNLDNPGTNILQTTSVPGISGLAVMPDNTRIFIATNDDLEAWHAQLELEQ
ncbi:MAG TPA: hypothetical protein PKA00_06110 [Saprospiraceae bacterium]|nr:hypothetical protein [Saprospiraceae bacterium]